MDGLMMDYPLTLTAILRRAESLFGRKEVVSRLPDKSFHRMTYRELGQRVRQLAVALEDLGITPGDRVATLCWNHHQHVEAYFGVPAMGGVVHTLNPRLHPDDLAYIVNHAEDRCLIVDGSLLPVWEAFRDKVDIPHVMVVQPPAAHGYQDYEEFLATGDPRRFHDRVQDERQAAAMCYTSGTTGRPKGVLYSHRALALHSLASITTDGLRLGEREVVCPVVPMFHANAWGLPFAAALAGASQVMPGPFLDPESLLTLFESEKVSITAGVPTIWLGILQTLQKGARAYDLSHLHTMLVGGAAAPRSLIQGFDEFGLRVVHAWGMTETTPLGSLSFLTSELLEETEAVQYDYRARQGLPAPFVETRAVDDHGQEVPWDGQTMGELQVRGAWVARAYYHAPEAADRFTEDGWFKTGDIVVIDPRGYLELKDRSKDVIKSGGEWISSVALENALMGHPAVAEAAVIAVAHPKWAERPLAVVVLKPGAEATAAELVQFLEPHFAKWWLPDAVEFVEAIPRTAAGKFLKSALREQFQNHPGYQAG